MVSGPRIQLIHAVAAAEAPTHEAFSRLWPEARPVDLADTALAADLSELSAAGELNGGALADAFTGRMAALIRYAVDTGADLELMRELCRRLASEKKPFDAEQAVALLDCAPELLEINQDVRQKNWRDELKK